MTVSVLANGLGEFTRFVTELPEIATEAAYLAVNEATRDAQPLLKRKMRQQINFSNAYLNSDRLGVRKKATRASLEAVISGRDRPTSLARFAEGATVANSRKRPIIVRVKAGQKRTLNRAFLVNLRNGNVGLAIRLPKGQTPSSAYKPVALTRGGGKETGAWLLYGPSVDQVLRGVSDEVAPDVNEMLSRNFFRQFTRLTRG